MLRPDEGPWRWPGAQHLAGHHGPQQPAPERGDQSSRLPETAHGEGPEEQGLRWAWGARPGGRRRGYHEADLLNDGSVPLLLVGQQPLQQERAGTDGVSSCAPRRADATPPSPRPPRTPRSQRPWQRSSVRGHEENDTQEPLLQAAEAEDEEERGRRCGSEAPVLAPTPAGAGRRPSERGAGLPRLPGGAEASSQGHCGPSSRGSFRSPALCGTLPVQVWHGEGTVPPGGLLSPHPTVGDHALQGHGHCRRLLAARSQTRRWTGGKRQRNDGETPPRCRAEITPKSPSPRKTASPLLTFSAYSLPLPRS